MWAPVLQKLQRETQHTPVSRRAAITSTGVHYISAAVGFRLMKGKLQGAWRCVLVEPLLMHFLINVDRASTRAINTGELGTHLGAVDDKS